MLDAKLNSYINILHHLPNRIPSMELPRSVINDSKALMPNRSLDESQEDNDRGLLTALSILESTPGGMINLEMVHQDTLACMRSRFYNEGGPCFPTTNFGGDCA